MLAGCVMHAVCHAPADDMKQTTWCIVLPVAWLHLLTSASTQYGNEEHLYAFSIRVSYDHSLVGCDIKIIHVYLKKIRIYNVTCSDVQMFRWCTASNC